MQDILKRNAIVGVVSAAAAMALVMAGLPVWLVIAIAVIGGSAYEFFATQKAEKQTREALEQAHKALTHAQQVIEQQRRLIKKFSRYFAQKAREQSAKQS